MIKKSIWLSVFILLSGGLFYAYYSYGFIAVTSEAGIELEVKRTGSKDALLVSQSSSRVKKLVRRGNYEVLAKQKDSNYFAITPVGGFMKTNGIEVRLEQEKSRVFVGDNPSPCVTLATVLVSISCSDKLSAMVVHKPATGKLPTYTERVNKNIEGRFEGFVNVSEGSFVLARVSLASSATTPRGHYIHSISNDGTFSKGTLLIGTDAEKTYTLLPHKGGFALHDSFMNILVYESLSQAPKIITAGMPKNTKLNPYSISVEGQGVAVAYRDPDDATDLIEDKTARGKTSIVVILDNTTRHFNFNKYIGQVELCGIKKLCLLSDNLLEVYDIAGQKPKLLYSVGNVESVLHLGERMLIVRAGDIIGFNIDKAEGAIQYEAGEYRFCGVQISGQGYVACVVDGNNKKRALFINPSQPGTDNIDKQIAELAKLQELQTISIYKNLIHLAPNYGDLITTQDGLDIDRTKKPAIDKIINGKIDDLGINRDVYTISTTYN